MSLRRGDLADGWRRGSSQLVVSGCGMCVLRTDGSRHKSRTQREHPRFSVQISPARQVLLPAGMIAATSSCRDLDVWREAMLLVEDVYMASRRFPADERFGLTARLRRAAISIPSNIGEGSRRKRRKAFRHHLDIALGSQGEVDVQIEIAMRLGFLGPREHDAIQDRVPNH